MEEQDLQQLNNEEGSGETVATAKPRSKKISRFIDILLWVLIAVLAVALIVRVFFYTQITISGESMTSDYYNTEGSAHYNADLTFHNNDVVGVKKLRKPKRGDVVVFYKNDGTNKFFDVFASTKSGDDESYTKLIKRVVAVAGDKLWVEQIDDEWYSVVIETAEGKLLYEDYYERKGTVLDKEAFYIKDIADSGLGILAEHKSKDDALVISEGCFFAMGDNRSNSADSRSFGEVPLSRIYGVVTKY